MMDNRVKAVTLVEILVATLVFLIVCGSLLNSIVTILYIIDIARDETSAVSDLRSLMEKINSTPFVSVTTLFPNGVIDGPTGNNYSNLVGGYKLKNEHITVNYADVNADPLEINVRLEWEDKRRHPHSIEMSTFKTK